METAILYAPRCHLDLSIPHLQGPHWAPQGSAHDMSSGEGVFYTQYREENS